MPVSYTNTDSFGIADGIGNSKPDGKRHGVTDSVAYSKPDGKCDGVTYADGDAIADAYVDV